ncbi:MAG: hypothetical protein R3A45_00285 [Bdellovibrionota bacterium]
MKFVPKSSRFLPLKKEQQLKTYAQDLLSQWTKNNATLSEAAKKKGYEIQHAEDITFSADGNIPVIGTSVEISKDLFAQSLKEQDFLPKVYEVQDKYYIAQMDKIQTPDMKTFTDKKIELWSVSSQEIAQNKLAALSERTRERTKIFQLQSEEL